MRRVFVMSHSVGGEAFSSLRRGVAEFFEFFHFIVGKECPRQAKNIEEE
jgi:hypothetical protein